MFADGVLLTSGFVLVSHFKYRQYMTVKARAEQARPGFAGDWFMVSRICFAVRPTLYSVKIMASSPGVKRGLTWVFVAAKSALARTRYQFSWPVLTGVWGHVSVDVWFERVSVRQRCRRDDEGGKVDRVSKYKYSVIEFVSMMFAVFWRLERTQVCTYRRPWHTVVLWLYEYCGRLSNLLGTQAWVWDSISIIVSCYTSMLVCVARHHMYIYV